MVPPVFCTKKDFFVQSIRNPAGKSKDSDQFSAQRQVHHRFGTVGGVLPTPPPRRGGGRHPTYQKTRRKGFWADLHNAQQRKPRQNGAEHPPPQRQGGSPPPPAASGKVPRLLGGGNAVRGFSKQPPTTPPPPEPPPSLFVSWDPEAPPRGALGEPPHQPAETAAARRAFPAEGGGTIFQLTGQVQVINEGGGFSHWGRAHAFARSLSGKSASSSSCSAQPKISASGGCAHHG